MDSKPRDIDTKSVISMQELDPSPVDDSSPDLETLENGEYFPKPEEDKPKRTCGFPAPKLGLRAHRWDALCMLRANLRMDIF
jgi:tRNA (guanine26-N2/guanine27-N2)-dimethyltransferase